MPSIPVGRYREGSTYVTWFCEVDGRHREITSENVEQSSIDVITATQYTKLPEVIALLQEVEIRLDAALHPVFDMDRETAISLVRESHAEIRKLLGMPAVEEVQL